MATPGLGRALPDADLMPEELRAAIVLFASLLDERRRRLFAGLESLKCGWGSDRRIASLLGIDPSTVAAGRRQLVERGCRGRPGARRGRGGGNGPKKTPEVIARIEALMAHETAGDPVSGLKWTRRTTVKIAEELCKLGINVCPQTVARLRQGDGLFAARHHKKLAGTSHPNRDEQFRHITELRERCAADKHPPHQRRYEEEELVAPRRKGRSMPRSGYRRALTILGLGVIPFLRK